MILQAKIEENCHLTYKALEDIQMLSSFGVGPVLSRALFHLLELKRVALEATHNEDGYNEIKQVVLQKIHQIIEDYFSANAKFKGYHLNHVSENYSLAKLNLILNILPEVLTALSFFSFMGGVNIHLSSGRIVFSGIILEDKNIVLSRKFFYLLHQKLLHLNVLMTFNVDQQKRSGLLNFELTIDYSFDENYVYAIEVRDQVGQVTLAFPNIFHSYLSAKDSVLMRGQHKVVKINSDLSHQVLDSIPSTQQHGIGREEIVHLPFLFCPLSIILPVGGKLVPKSLIENQGDTGSGSQGQSKSHRYYYIDFFSLAAE